MTAWSQELNELKQLQKRLKRATQALQEELSQLFETHDDVAALVRARRALETIVIELCGSELQRDRGTEPLSGVIAKLRIGKHVPENIAISMENLNRLGNFGAHPKPFQKQQVREALMALASIIEWYTHYLEARSPRHTGQLKPPTTQTDVLHKVRSTRKLNLLEHSVLRPLKSLVLLGSLLCLGAGGMYAYLKYQASETALQQQDPQQLIQRGYQAFLAQDYDLALRLYNQCIQADPTYAAAYNNRALVQQALEDWPAALQDSNQAIALDPDYAVSYSARGWTYLNMGLKTEALEDLNHAIDLRQDSRWPYYYRGQYYLGERQCDKAQADFKQACELGHQEACQLRC